MSVTQRCCRCCCCCFNNVFWCCIPDSDYFLKMATPCHQSCSPALSSQCSSPLSIDDSSNSTPCEALGRKLFDDEAHEDSNPKISTTTFAESTKKKLYFPMSSPEVSELHQHLQALDGLEGLSKWPFSRKRSTPNTSPKRKSVTFFGDIQKFSAEIRAIENRTNELHHDNSIHSNAALRNLDSNRAESQRKFWLLSLGFISISLVCFIMFCVVPIILSSPLPKFPSRQ